VETDSLSKLAEIIGHAVPLRGNTVIVLVSVDASGHPRPCLLSPYQVVFDPKSEKVTIAVYAESATSTNLAERRRATLIFFTPPSALYVQGEVEPLKKSSVGIAFFRLAPTRIKEDYSASTPITCEPLFDDSKVKERYLEVFLECSNAG